MSEKYDGGRDRLRVVPPPAPYTYWLTRCVDRRTGLEFVAVWRVLPRRVPLEGGGADWIDPDPRGQLHGYVGSVWPVECWQMAGTCPEDSIECVRVERRAPLKIDAAPLPPAARSASA